MLTGSVFGTSRVDFVSCMGAQIQRAQPSPVQSSPSLVSSAYRPIIEIPPRPILSGLNHARLSHSSHAISRFLSDGREHMLNLDMAVSPLWGSAVNLDAASRFPTRDSRPRRDGRGTGLGFLGLSTDDASARPRGCLAETGTEPVCGFPMHSGPNPAARGQPRPASQAAVTMLHACTHGPRTSLAG